jgi:hypothetical protein
MCQDHKGRIDGLSLTSKISRGWDSNEIEKLKQTIPWPVSVKCCKRIELLSGFNEFNAKHRTAR